MSPMTGDPRSDDFGLLSLCAILRWFDRDRLLLFAEGAADRVAALLSSDAIEPALDEPGAYCLREAIQTGVLTRLRAERPNDELALHGRAFEQFLPPAGRLAPGDWPASDESRCFYHLGELLEQLTARREWQAIARYVAVARAAGPLQDRHLRLLLLYDGLVAIRTANYDSGEMMLAALLGQPDLDGDLRVRTLNALGHVYWFKNQFDRALALYRQVHLLGKTIGDTLYHGLGLLNMGIVYVELGYYEQALDLCEQSLEIFCALGNRCREAHARYEIGHCAMNLGRWQIAQNQLHEAIRLYEALGVTADLAMLSWCQGFLLHILGREIESEAAYLHSLSIACSPDYGTPSAAMDILLFLGFLYQTQGYWDAALTSYEQAITIADRIQNRHSLTLIHYRRGETLKQQGYLDAAAQAYQQAIEIVESLRGAAESEEIKIGLLGPTELGTTQQMFEAMVLLCLELGRTREAFAYVERARSRAFLDLLASKSPDLYDAVDQPIVTLAEVQARLPADALLLEYFTTGVLPRGERLITKLPPENTRLRDHLALPPHTLIFAITRDTIEVHDAPIDPNRLRPHEHDPVPGRRLLRGRQLAYLYESLIAPVEHLVRGRGLLYLIPHGPLHYVPFMALHTSGGEHLLAAGGPAIALAPSATVLLRNCLDRPRAQAVGMLALGYNARDAEALRYAEAEARHVARLTGGDAWAGPAPKSERLIAEAPNVRWLHIASHAVFTPHDPLGSYLWLGADDALNARAIISKLTLRADLVTLSACTSGLSHVVAGDELLGLQRALLCAGAPTVVCTLWEAADLVALIVMDRFYSELCRGRPPAEALREAQTFARQMTGRELLAMIDRWRAEDPAAVAALDLPPIPPEYFDAAIYADPLYWAPFMLIGRPD